MQNGFQGPERRRHRLFVTRNTEYHVRDGRVVAVRHRNEDGWVANHAAIGMAIRGHIERDTLVPREGEPNLGERLYLANGANDIVTSTVIAVERPPKAVVEAYPSIAA